MRKKIHGNIHEELSLLTPALFGSSSTLGKVITAVVLIGLFATLISPPHSFQKQISKVQALIVGLL